MRNQKILFVVVGLFISACSNADYVPNVNDVENIILDGKKITKIEFFQKFCSGAVRGQKENETCSKVRISMATDSIRGKTPKGW